MAKRVAESEYELTAEDKTKAAFRSAKKKFDDFAASTAKFSAGAAVAAAGAVGTLTFRGLALADSLDDASRKIGIQNDQLAIMRKLSFDAGAGVGTMDEALTKAVKRLGEFNATGGGAAAAWLKRLNLDTRELAGLEPDQLFLRYGKAIRGLNDRGQQLAAISALLGDESRQLITVIDGGQAAFEAAAQKARDYGLALTDIENEQLAEANAIIKELQQRFDGLANLVAVEVAPVIIGVGNAFLDSAGTADDFREKSDAAFESVGKAVGAVADTVFGLNLVFKGVEVAVLNLASQSLFPLQQMEEAATFVGNAFRRIAGKDAVDPQLQAIAVMKDSLEQSAAAAEKALEKLAGAEKPSERFEKAIKKAREELEQAAAAAANAREEADRLRFDAPLSTAGDEKEEAKRQERIRREQEAFDASLRRQLESVNEFILSREEREIAAAERRLMIADEAFAAGIIAEERRIDIQTELQRRLQERLTQIHNEGFTEREKFSEKAWKAQVGHVSGALVQITQGVATSSKKLFALNKAAALANAIVNTREAVTEALSHYPPPISFVMAAAQAAAGAAQVNAIRNSQFGGGTTPSAAGTTPTVGDQPVRPQQSPLPAPQASQGEGGPVVNIIFEGSIFGLEEFEDQVREAVRAAVDDQDAVLFGGDSAQAAEIRRGGG